MKLKQRCFDGTCLKKDITRFAPAWALYLIGGVMIAVSTISDVAGYSYGVYEVPNSLGQCIGYFGMINLVYAMLIAQLLYGDLFNSKLCNALHAMPLRREGWFLTHLVAGLLFSLVPNLVIALSIMPYLGQYWYTSFLWLLGMEMHYLFFFGLAVFSMFCTGRRFAAVAVYGILNFLSLLVLWFAYTIYVPMLYGFVLDSEAFLPFSPVIWLCNRPDYFTVEHLDSCLCKHNSYYAYGSYYMSGGIYDPAFTHKHAWGGLGDSWGYLGILTAIGAVLLVLALLLYKRRQLENAGNFVAFRVMKPIFWVIFAMGCGGVCAFFIETLLGHSGFVKWLFLGIGIVVGYFVGQMLVERTVKVFKRPVFIQFIIFLAAFALSLLLTWLDPLGFTRYIPNADKVEKVYLLQNEWTVQEIREREKYSYNWNGLVSEDPEDIARVQQLHQLYIDEGRGRDHTSYTVCYELENGQTVTRYYAPAYNSGADMAAQMLLGRADLVVGFDSLEQMQAAVNWIKADSIGSFSEAAKDSLLEALWADAESGKLAQNSRYHRQLCSCGGALSQYTVCYSYTQENGRSVERSLSLYSCCSNTIHWLKENIYQGKSIFDILTADELRLLVQGIDSELLWLDRYSSPEDINKLVVCLYTDLAYKQAVSAGEATEAQAASWKPMEVTFLQGDSEKLLLSPESSTWEFLKTLSKG